LRSKYNSPKANIAEKGLLQNESFVAGLFLCLGAVFGCLGYSKADPERSHGLAVENFLSFICYATFFLEYWVSSLLFCCFIHRFFRDTAAKARSTSDSATALNGQNSYFFRKRILRSAKSPRSWDFPMCIISAKPSKSIAAYPRSIMCEALPTPIHKKS